MQVVRGLIVVLLWAVAVTGCDDGGDSNESTPDSGPLFDCAEYAAANCDPMCACGPGPVCALNAGGGSLRFENREECIGFFEPICQLTVDSGAAAQLEAQFVDCREDLLTAECTGEDDARSLLAPESCQSNG